MKRFVILLFIVLSYSNYCQNNTNNGLVNVNVTYPVLQLLYIPGNGAVQGETIHDGVLNINNMVPPGLDECEYLTPDDNPLLIQGYYKTINNWDAWYIPFKLIGAKGVGFHYELTPLTKIAGDPGVVVAAPNLKGSKTGTSFQAIPLPGQPTNAVLHTNGEYFIRMHFSTLWIKYQCSQGTRTFRTTLTCNYL